MNRISVGLLHTFALLGALSPCAWPQDLEELKQGIVRISARVDGKTKTGTGFVVRLQNDAAYIVTAAHVVEGDPHPKVAFYPRANEFFQSDILGLEGGDPRGVAALIARTENMPEGVRAFAISTTINVRGGEAVTIIGFPNEPRTPWLVTTGTQFVHRW